MKVVSTKLSNTEWEKLIDRCNEKGTTIAEYLRELIKGDINKISVPDIQGKEQSLKSELRKLLESSKKKNT